MIDSIHDAGGLFSDLNPNESKPTRRSEESSKSAAEKNAQGFASLCETEGSTPSMDEWRTLYAQADELRKMEPWRRMLDGQWFGVKEPISGETVYVTIMGNRGEFFAVGGYLGTKGLNVLRMFQAESFGSGPDADPRFLNRCLMLSFNDRKYLEKDDLKVIKALGFKYQGAKSWPQFQSFRPGYVPWGITREEGVFMADFLDQVLQVCGRLAEQPALLETQPSGHYLVRVKEDGRWRDASEPPAPEPPAVPPPIMFEAEFARLQGRVKMSDESWEGDAFYLRLPTKDKTDERPYFPVQSMWVCRRTGIILGAKLLRPKNVLVGVQEHFLDVIKQYGFAPKEIRLRRADMAAGLLPYADRLNLRVEMAARLPALDPVIRDFINRFC